MGNDVGYKLFTVPGEIWNIGFLYAQILLEKTEGKKKPRVLRENRNKWRGALRSRRGEDVMR